MFIRSLEGNKVFYISTLITYNIVRKEGGQVIIGPKLRSLRKTKGLTQRGLAKKTGLSHSFICDIELGRSNPSIVKLVRLSQALGVNPDFFLNNLFANNERSDSNVKSTG